MKLTKSIRSTRTSPLRTLGSEDLDAVVGGIAPDETEVTSGQSRGRRQHEPVIVITEH